MKPMHVVARRRTSSHVVIVGAGPAGLLCAINLLRRNAPGDTKYTVELVDGGENYGLLDEKGLQKKRSWMIGLAWPGLRAIRRVPGLFDEYVGKVGVEIRNLALYFGSKKVMTGSGEPTEASENYLVDRNLICAALARYLNAHFASSEQLTTRYHTKCNFVDAEQRRVHLRAADGTESYSPYDLLVGADGVRSAVRAALVANHRDFDCSVSDIFERFKAVHIPLPPGVEDNTMHTFPSCLPNVNGVGMVATGGRINISMGHRLHAPCDAALRSTDAAVVAAYLRANFKAIPLPWDDFAAAWVGIDWQSTTMTHCSSYHSLKLQLLIMGDAAHATSPSIGMGMNHALADAAALDELLHAHGGELALALPAYSAERVKEGQALTDVADFVQCYDSSAQPMPHTGVNGLITLRQVLRGVGNAILPSLVAPEPYMAIGGSFSKGMKLSEAYAILTRTGRLQQVRRINSEIRQRYFAEAAGMVPPPPPLRRSWRALLTAALVVAAAFAWSSSSMPPAAQPLPAHGAKVFSIFGYAVVRAF